jgi:hypothetical protein
MKQFGDRQVGDLIVDRGAEEDDPLVEETRVDVEGALAVHGLLDHHRDQRAHGRSPILCFRRSSLRLVRSAGIGLASRLSKKRLAEVEQVNARLESAALTTSRSMAEISKHWDAVYEAMRRSEE